MQQLLALCAFHAAQWASLALFLPGVACVFGEGDLRACDVLALLLWMGVLLEVLMVVVPFLLEVCR